MALLNPDYPLAATEPWDDGRSGGVGPESGEPGAFPAGHGKQLALLFRIGVPGSADGQDQAVQCRKGVLHP